MKTDDNGRLPLLGLRLGLGGLTCAAVAIVLGLTGHTTIGTPFMIAAPVLVLTGLAMILVSYRRASRRG